MVLVGTGYFVWDRYFSSQAKANRETQKNYEKYLAWQKNYEKAMTEDTFGGKTPEETLQMFIEALKKEDVDLASKYFSLGEDGKLRKEIIEGLQKIQEEKKFQVVADIVSKSKFDSRHSSDNTVWFTVENKNGVIEYSVILNLNKYSGVWKIESL